MNSLDVSKERSNLSIVNESAAFEDHKNEEHNKILNSIEDSKLNRIKKCFKEMIMNSTIHALPKIIMTDKFYSKIMWILFFIISFGFNLQLISKSITDYLAYETISTISIEYEQPGN